MKNNDDQLEFIISTLDTLYELGENCIHPITNKLVSDAEYDEMRTRLAKIKPNSYIFDTVTGSTYKSAAKKVTHNPPMTSISKANGTWDEKMKILKDWEKNVVKELNKGNVEDFAICAFKWDGVACALYYEKGKLISAGLRPRDGVSGEDITENVKYVEGVSEDLPINFTGSIRGEIVCMKSVFEKKNKELAKRGEKTFANPRNYAAGSIRQFKDPKITKERCLSFTAYNIISDDAPSDNEVERAKWCNKVLKIPHVQVRSFNYDYLKKMEDFSASLDYEVDGIVISINSVEDREQLGSHGDSPTGNPKGRIAWKFAEEMKEVEIKSIECCTGRTGRIVPVLMFDPIQLAGTNVTQCTGHNYGFMIRNKIKVGTVIKIIKSGKIIPKIVGVIKNTGDWDYPKKCSSCNSDTHIVQGGDGVELECHNNNCVSKIVNCLCHYLNTLGVKGIAESTVEKLVEAGLVRYPADFYRLDYKQLQDLGLGDRNSILIIARLWNF